MATQTERLMRLNQALVERRDICCSEGVVEAFPAVLQKTFRMDYLGLIVCEQGSFRFTLDRKPFTAKAGETVFCPNLRNSVPGHVRTTCVWIFCFTR